MRRKNFTYPVTSLAGTTPVNFIRLLRLHKAEGKYFFKILLSFLAALIFTPLNLIERIIWSKKIRRFQMKEKPVFIIGFNRSGTTMLHNLLCLDPKAGYTTTLQTVFPHCILTQQWWLRPLFNFFVPAKRPFDHVPMDMDFPQEEEFALANLQLHSIYNFFLFPSEFNWFIDHDYLTAELPGQDLDRWKQAYHNLAVKSLLNTGGVRFTSKNPQNIPRARILNEMYPGAGFIFIYRDPYVVVESFYHFILAICQGIQIQDVPGEFSREQVARFYAIAMTQYTDLKENSGIPVHEIKMEDFMRDKISGLRNIYSVLGLQGIDNALPEFEAYLGRNSGSSHETTKIHDDTIRYVNRYAEEFVIKFGYDLRTCQPEQPAGHKK